LQDLLQRVLEYGDEKETKDGVYAFTINSWDEREAVHSNVGECSKSPRFDEVACAHGLR
jgi:hypothetical protein